MGVLKGLPYKENTGQSEFGENPVYKPQKGVPFNKLVGKGLIGTFGYGVHPLEKKKRVVVVPEEVVWEKRGVCVNPKRRDFFWKAVEKVKELLSVCV